MMIINMNRLLRRAGSGGIKSGLCGGGGGGVKDQLKGVLENTRMSLTGEHSATGFAH